MKIQFFSFILLHTNIHFLQHHLLKKAVFSSVSLLASTGYFSVSEMKYHTQKKLGEEGFYFSLQFQRDRAQHSREGVAKEKT